VRPPIAFATSTPKLDWPRQTSEAVYMERIEKTMEVDCPVRTVYDQWTQFEGFPKVMAGVKEVRQLDDMHLYRRPQIWGKEPLAQFASSAGCRPHHLGIRLPKDAGQATASTA
jgi:hypothetical protein